MEEIVIVSAVRTPIGKFLGSLSSLPATVLGSRAVAAAVERSGIRASDVEMVILGNVVSAGLGQNPARQAALGAGLDPAVSALAINKVCGSGLEAVVLAARSIRAGDARIVVAGGMESLSRAPYLLSGLRTGLKLGHGEIQDSVIRDGLWCSMSDQHMGLTAELAATEHGVTREDQDRFALESHRKAIRAMDEGAFEAEIVPVEVPGRKGEVQRVRADECPRRDTSIEALGKLRPAFRPDGTVTAGNAPGLNDGAAALVVMSESEARSRGLPIRARITGYAAGGVEPRWVMMAPVQACRHLFARTGTTASDFDLVEANEAFSAQALAVCKELALDLERVNVHGGAVALGHPLGASGARILTTLLHALERRSLRRGLATLCLGGGEAVSLSIERPTA